MSPHTHTQTHTRSHVPHQRVILYTAPLRCGTLANWKKQTFLLAKTQSRHPLRFQGREAQHADAEGLSGPSPGPMWRAAEGPSFALSYTVLFIVPACFYSSMAHPKRTHRWYLVSFQNTIVRCSNSSSLMGLNQIR